MLELGEGKDALGECVETDRFCLQHLEQACALVSGEVVALQEVDAAEDAREWRLDLVGDVGDEGAAEGFETLHLLEFAQLGADSAEGEEEEEQSRGAGEACEKESQSTAFRGGVNGVLGESDANREVLDLLGTEEEVVVVALHARIEDLAATVAALDGQAIAVGLAGFADGVDGREVAAGKGADERFADKGRARFKIVLGCGSGGSADIPDFVDENGDKTGETGHCHKNREESVEESFHGAMR